jgi:hypothetical protein
MELNTRQHVNGGIHHMQYKTDPSKSPSWKMRCHFSFCMSLIRLQNSPFTDIERSLHPATNIEKWKNIYIYNFTEVGLELKSRLHRRMHTAPALQEASTKASYDRLTVKAPQCINTRITFLPLRFI